MVITAADLRDRAAKAGILTLIVGTDDPADGEYLAFCAKTRAVFL